MPKPCPGCRERDQRIARLEQQVAELIAEVRDLKARLGQNASNSSLPPSANPPDAPKPVVKTPTGRKPGGQPGHPPHMRLRLPPERLKQTILYIPKVCEDCQAALPATPGSKDPEPIWHQVAELPPMLAEITEHQAHARTCRRCGHLNWEKIPDAIRAHVTGPRLSAVLSYLSGCPHVSKRGIEEIVETVFAAPIALGTVANLEGEMSAALAAAHAEAQQAVQMAPSKHVDETGWKQAGKPCWLWAAATTLVACFVIHPTRSALGLAALLGKKIKGIVCSDRWSVYGQLKLGLRQLCWAHLKRDFQKLVDRGGEAKTIGEMGLGAVEVLFEVWYRFRGGTISRRQMQCEIAYIRPTLQEWLERGCACTDSTTANFCANVLAVERAMWTFVYKEGVEPTNNHIERLLRSGVMWRKRAFGSHSEKGCRFVERILTVVQTLRLQKRPVVEFLYQSLLAHRHGQRAPQLLLDG
jgi:transposase